MAISLLETIKNGDPESAKRILLQKKYTLIDRQSAKKDGTPLFWACCQGYLDIVHLLLLHGAGVNTCTAWGATPLHASADHNNVEILILLLKYGARVNQTTNNGDTACHLAAYRGHAACVQRLAEGGANVEIRNNKRHTPIQEAYMQGHYDIYRYLVSVQKLVNKNKQPSLSTQMCDPQPFKNSVEDSAPPPPQRHYFTRSPVNDTVSASGAPIRWLSSPTSDTDCAASYSSNQKYNSITDKKVRNGVIGVLRLRNVSRQDSLEDNTSVEEENTSGNDSLLLNDLSSMECSGLSSSDVPSGQMLSFKNIY